MQFTPYTLNDGFPEFDAVPPAFPTLASLKEHLPSSTDPRKVESYLKLIERKLGADEGPTPIRVYRKNAASFAEALCMKIESTIESCDDQEFSVTTNEVIGFAWVSNEVKIEFSRRILERSSEAASPRWGYLRTQTNGLIDYEASLENSASIINFGPIEPLCRLIRVDAPWSREESEKSRTLGEHLQSLGRYQSLGWRAKISAIGELASDLVQKAEYSAPLASRLKIVASCFPDEAAFVGDSLIATAIKLSQSNEFIHSASQSGNLGACIVITLSQSDDFKKIEELAIHLVKIVVDKDAKPEAKKIAASVLVGIAHEEVAAVALATEAILDLRFDDGIEDSFIAECISLIAEPTKGHSEAVYEHNGFGYLLGLASSNNSDLLNRLLPIATAIMPEKSCPLTREVLEFAIEQRLLANEKGVEVSESLLEGIHRANPGALLQTISEELLLYGTQNTTLLQEASEAIGMLNARGYTFQKFLLDDVQSLIERRMTSANEKSLPVLTDLFICTSSLFVSVGNGRRSTIFESIFKY